MDLTKPGSYPRSGRETLGGVVYLARAMDKMRADLAGKVGEYVAACPQSRKVYDLYGVTAEQFREAVQKNASDDGALRWLQEHGTAQPTKEDISQFNKRMLQDGPDAGNMDYFRETLQQAGQEHRTDIRTWVDLQDIEEERPVPQRA
ncbi:MAG: DUF5069 domain-containing protein [Chloroflexota bacterium]|nr:DUF5069 domain-containing protein [Chloroflexota bacterium]